MVRAALFDVAVGRLSDANKDFDLIMLPNQQHPYLGEAGTYIRRRRDFCFFRPTAA